MGGFVVTRRKQFHSNCGDEFVKLQLPNYNSDIIVAMGNSKGMVIKVEGRTNRRNEVSYKDKIWVQRLGKARKSCW